MTLPILAAVLERYGLQPVNGKGSRVCAGTTLFNLGPVGTAESSPRVRASKPVRMRSKTGPALAAAGRLSILPPRFSSACRGRGRCREDGQATLEMVVSLTVIFSLVFWLFELCMFTYTCSVLNDAAQEGVRYAIMHGTDSSVCSGPDTVCTNQTPYSNVQAVVTAAASASLHNTSAMTVTVSYANSTAATGNPVAVKVAYTYVPYLNFPGLANALTFTSQGQILY
jgi:Flp pilus assembly protein TadG